MGLVLPRPPAPGPSTTPGVTEPPEPSCPEAAEGHAGHSVGRARRPRARALPMRSEAPSARGFMSLVRLVVLSMCLVLSACGRPRNGSAPGDAGPLQDSDGGVRADGGKG